MSKSISESISETIMEIAEERGTIKHMDAFRQQVYTEGVQFAVEVLGERLDNDDAEVER